MSMFRRKAPVPLGIKELAVDPADVDRETYPVTIRLTRPMTQHEVRALSELQADLDLQPDALVVPDAKLDDIAHGHATWSRMLERAESVAVELDGEALIADEQRDARLRAGTGTTTPMSTNRTGSAGMS